MSIRQLIDKLLDRWPAKIICLMLAIFLYVFHQVSLIDKKVFVVPLTVQEDGNVMQIGDCPATVSVIVRAQSDVINTITNADLHASVNLNTIAKSGPAVVPVSVTLTEKLMVYDPLEVRVKPENITINVERKIAKYVPIEPSVSGKVAEGYMISSITMNPSAVEIIGPESLVNATESIQTTALIVNNAETNFADEVKYLSVNKLIDVVDAGPYKATVVVEPQPLIKDYTGIHIVPRGLKDNLEIESEIPDIDFSISGTVPVLGKYIISANVVQIDLSNITEAGSYDIPVKFNLPGAFSLEKKSFESVSITIKEKTDKLLEVVETEKVQ